MIGKRVAKRKRFLNDYKNEIMRENNQNSKKKEEKKRKTSFTVLLCVSNFISKFFFRNKHNQII